mgnify:FL=1
MPDGNFCALSVVHGEEGGIAMRLKLSLLAFAFIAATGFLLALAWQPTGPAGIQKTDRLVGNTEAPFLMERFAG